MPTVSASLKPYRHLVRSLIQVIENGKVAAGRVVNQAMTTTYWVVGRQVVEHDQGGTRRAGYGEELIPRLSKELTTRFGRGLCPRNLD